jgi:hypothetical protein
MTDFIEGDPFDPVVAQMIEDKSHERTATEQQAVHAMMQRSKSAYKRVFETGNANPDDVEFVMKDLMFFARSDEHYFSDARVQDVMAGRKQMLQRIFEYTSIDVDTLYRKYVTQQA